MRLKQLEVQGYKSFANKVEFAFDGGITAVVGPNGSGKSNVADAIRWVLGEQSYSNLRGKKTEDMIFSGSDGRARLGMAAATLVLDNSDKWLPLDFSEVTISRRAYRSGENEYYLNGSRVRLKDITELLTKGGLRRQTYTVIGQGTVDRVLSLQADERRQLFEEAAGITYQRHKRASALAKLETTQANLLRANDIVNEIEPQLKRLEKQAERTKEYDLVKVHMDGLLRVWYGYRWRQAQVALREATARLHQSETLVNEQRKAVNTLNREVMALRSEQTETRASLSLWYAENNHLNRQAEAIQRELAVTQERAHQYAAQREEILAELAPLTTNLEAQQRLVAEAEARLEQINQELSQAQAALRQAQGRLAGREAQQQQAVARRQEAEGQARQLADTITQRQARLIQLNERRETLLAERETRAQEIAEFRRQQEELQAKQLQWQAGLSGLEGEGLALETQQSEQRKQLAQLNQEAERLKAQMGEVSRKEEALKARQDVLDKLRHEMSGYYAGVRAVLQAGSHLLGIVGPVGQLLQAPPDLEVALEAALGSRLQDVAVETFANAERAIAYLKETGQGRATFLPLDTIRPGKAVVAPDTPGVVGLASELVAVEARLRPIAELALNRTIIVDDLAAARRAFEAASGAFQIVTREGELMRSGGSVTGGRNKGPQGQESAFLAREREWRELPAEIDALAGHYNSLSGQLADAHERVAAVDRRLRALADRQQQQIQQRQEVEAAADKIHRALEQLAANIAWQEELQAKAGAELEQIGGREVATQQEITTLREEQQAAAALAQQLAQEAQALSAENLAAEVSRAKSEATAIGSNQQNQRALLASQQATYRQLAVQIESKSARAQTLAAERDALLNRQQELKERGGEFEAQLAEFSEKIKAGEKALSELEARQVQRVHDEDNLRQRLRRLEIDHNRLSLEAARCQNDLDHLQRQIHDDLGLVHLEMSEEQIGQPLLPLQNLATDLPLIEELPPGVEEDVKRLKIQLRRLGSINPEAPRELAELSERHQFLTHQIEDLEAAVADLREVIAKLDAAMEEAFADTFQQAAKEFQRYFKTLFGGGEAQLLLTDPDNLIDTGVEIVARPPGKRLQSLALLSGGERSLTAQALIFALLRTSPTPFVVFDEVDAMLDEANVGRFRDALAKLSQDIQFIVITHNRKTIEAANTLYGISMGDDSVSQVYSLRIDEWLADKKVRDDNGRSL
jgi:chromosome segregation protein